MKKLVLPVLLTLLLLLSCGCEQHQGNMPNPAESAADAAFEEYASHISSSIQERLYYSAIVSVGGTAEKVEIRIDPATSGKLSAFGERIYRTVQVCEDVMQGNEFSLRIPFIDSGKVVMVFSSSVGGYGALADNRGGETKGIPLSDVNDLIAEFPALRRYVNLEKCPPEDVEMYHSVMTALSAEPSKSEEEIMGHYAESAGKSLDELTWFMRYMLDVSTSGKMQDAKDDGSADYFRGLAAEIDPIVFDTTAAENGYGGSIFRLDGCVSELYSVAGYSCAILDTENGVFHLILNRDLVEWIESEHPLRNTGWANWHTMNVGDAVSVYVYYLGFSDVMGAANGVFLYAE